RGHIEGQESSRVKQTLHGKRPSFAGEGRLPTGAGAAQAGSAPDLSTRENTPSVRASRTVSRDVLQSATHLAYIGRVRIRPDYGDKRARNKRTGPGCDSRRLHQTLPPRYRRDAWGRSASTDV